MEPAIDNPLPRPGQLIAGKYRIEGCVGEGGMGAVFAARHEQLNQLVAIKVLKREAASNEALVGRFHREAQHAAALQSEHVARVFDVGVTAAGGLPYLVMEHLEGEDLGAIIERKEMLPHQLIVDYALQAVDALAQAHANGIVHRDLKPSNLFIAQRPDGSTALKVVDFGISKAFEQQDAQDKILTGKALLGSPSYMAPEQIRQAGSVDPRSDIWSLGVTMYELLSGKLPFDGEGVGEVLAAVLMYDAEPLAVIAPHVDPVLANVVERCIKRERDDRFPNVGELATALVPFASPKSAHLAERAVQTLRMSGAMRSAPQSGVTPAGVARDVSGDTPTSDRRILVPQPEPSSSRRLPLTTGARGRLESAPTLMDDSDQNPATVAVHRPPQAKSRVPTIVAAALGVVLVAVAGGIMVKRMRAPAADVAGQRPVARELSNASRPAATARNQAKSVGAAQAAADAGVVAAPEDAGISAGSKPKRPRVRVKTIPVRPSILRSRE